MRSDDMDMEDEDDDLGHSAEWREHLIPINTASLRPPSWVLPGLLPPGMTLLFGDPKSYKSHLALHMMAALVDRVPFTLGEGTDNKITINGVRDNASVIYAAPEQSAGRIRWIYEQRIARRPMDESAARYSLSMLKNPAAWQLNAPQGDRDFTRLLEHVKPTLLVLDPLIYFHSLDENDPILVQPILPLKELVTGYGGSLLIVHHANKAPKLDKKAPPSAVPQGPPDFSRVRGTSALWGMADAGLMTTRVGYGKVYVAAEFKDHPGNGWLWNVDEFEGGEHGSDIE